MAIGIEVDWQQNGIRGQLRRLHDAHAGEHAERTRLVSRGRDDAAPDIVPQTGKPAAAVRLLCWLMITASADHHWQAAQFGITQQIDRRVEGVHVEMRNAAGGGDHRGAKIPENPGTTIEASVWARIGTLSNTGNGM